MSLRIAYFGTYDPGYARNRVLIDGLRAAGAEVLEYAAPLDSSLNAAQMATRAGAGKLAGELARAHLSLLARHHRGVSFDVVIVGYPGHLLVPLAWTVARYQHAMLVFDPLVSLFDTFAGDRELVSGDSAAGHLTNLVDRVAFGLPDLVLADTQAHASYYATALDVPLAKLAVVPVGALPLPGARGAARELAPEAPLRVVQYGRWSPLHGLPVVLEAADELRHEPFRFELIGDGQLASWLADEVWRLRLEAVDLVEHDLRVDDDTVADDRRDVRIHDPARDQMELERAPAVHDRVSRIVAALEADDIVHVVSEQIGDLAFAFVAPLGAQHNRSLCSHGHPFFSEKFPARAARPACRTRVKNQAEPPAPHHFR